mmetsp:Transcript_76113/g.88490  ORF Transcript_76113/g.88490 Transcript_76113/m.88490 type:complete len:82 (+) Transcript_76113:35-280(+)
MQVKYRPPSNDKDECAMLEKNFLTCLKEKAAKDEVPKLTCKVENILWFILECPTKYSNYEDPTKLRNIFRQVKEKPNQLPQ